MEQTFYRIYRKRRNRSQYVYRSLHDGELRWEFTSDPDAHDAANPHCPVFVCTAETVDRWHKEITDWFVCDKFYLEPVAPFAHVV